MTEAKLTFYAVTQCGYFKRNSEVPVFGDLPTLCREFAGWAKDGVKTLVETCTYHPKESSSLLRTFCYDCHRDDHTGDYLLVTWNETPSVDGNVAHVSETQEVGKVKVSSVPLPVGAIPGFATYFYFVPSSNAYATVRFSSPLNGNAGMQKLLREFAGKFSTSCVHDADEASQGRLKVLGYKNGGEDILHLYPRFSASLLRQPTFLEYIVASRSRIYKIHRKNLLVQGRDIEPESTQLFPRLFKALGARPEVTRSEVEVSYEMKVTPTKAELATIIENWSAEIAQDRTKWEDVGFQLQGEQEIRWLSSAMVKLESEISVTPDANGMVDPKKLFSELQRIRPLILRTLS